MIISLNFTYMKPKKCLSIMKALIVPVFFFAGLLNPSASIGQSPAVQVAEAKPELGVSLLGGVGDHLLFEVVMQQPGESKAILRIRNEEGIELFNESVSRKNFVRRISIPKEGLQKLEFSFSTAKGEVKKSLEIKIEYKESVEVKDITRL